MAKVVWTTPGLEDVGDVFDYIAKDSAVYAERFCLKLVESPRRLEKFPLMGQVVPEFGDETIREIVCGSFRVIYKVQGDACYITAVIHASRDILRHLDPADWVF